MKNYRLIYDLLQSQGLTQERCMQVGMKKKPSELFRLKNNLLKHINDQETPDYSELDLMVNSNMSGESMHFNNHQLRVDRIEETLSSTLLYADRIWIKNPLDAYIHSDEEYFNDETGKSNFLIDVFILYLYRDALELSLIHI